VERKVFRSGPYAELIAQAVQVGDVIYLSGQVGVDEQGDAPDSLVAQTTLAYEHVKAVLAEFGATLHNVVEETVFVTDMTQTMAQVQEVFAARAAAYGGRPDVTQTLVAVSALVDPAFKIEIKCTAHLQGSSGEHENHKTQQK
jgi:enamine deaminase RidA (YjgF/YER057c/UK114 family)